MHDYLLITLPQSVRYAEGLSGEIKIDVHGKPVEWEGGKETAPLREKVLAEYASSLRPHTLVA